MWYTKQRYFMNNMSQNMCAVCLQKDKYVKRKEKK